MAANRSKERRKYSRVRFEADVDITQNEKILKADLVDISLNGLLVVSALQAAIDKTPCSIVIKLSSDTYIQMEAELAHIKGNLLGFKCTGIDIDSMVHLRRLLEINLGEANAARKILHELIQRYPE